MARPWRARRGSGDDARLVARVRAGDERAFETIFDRHHAAILAFCQHLTGHREDAEDALQHTFIAAYREITGSQRELALKPWLFTVARNRCMSLLRARRSGEPLEAAGDAGSDLLVEVERREDLRQLAADLGRLPEQQRAALVLSELEALSHDEIATVLSVEPAKVRSLVFQARSSLLSTRAARDTACSDIREQLASLRGPALRRRTLRRHVRDCAGCREFEAAVTRQRSQLALILPVAASPGLREATLGLIAANAGGAAAGGAAVLGGSGLAGAGGAAVGAAGGGAVGAAAGASVAKLAVVAAVAATGTVGVAKAHLPERLGLASSGEQTEVRGGAIAQEQRTFGRPGAVLPGSLRRGKAPAGAPLGVQLPGDTRRSGGAAPGSVGPGAGSGAGGGSQGRSTAPGQAAQGPDDGAGGGQGGPGLGNGPPGGGGPPGQGGGSPGQGKGPPGGGGPPGLRGGSPGQSGKGGGQSLASPGQGNGQGLAPPGQGKGQGHASPGQGKGAPGVGGPPGQGGSAGQGGGPSGQGGGQGGGPSGGGGPAGQGGGPPGGGPPGKGGQGPN